MKNITRLFTCIAGSLCFLCTGAFSQSTQVLYKFENNVNDTSGNANHGTGNNLIYGSDIANVMDASGFFFGPTPYVTVPSAWISNVTSGVGFSVWFRTDNSAAPAGIAYAGDAAVGGTPANFTPIMWIDSAGYLCGFIYDGNISYMISQTPVNDNQWHHAVFYAEFVSNAILQYLWIDGQMHSTESGIISGQFNFNNMYVGACNPRNFGGMPDVWEYFEGKLDEARFFINGGGDQYFHNLDLAITLHPQSTATFSGVNMNLSIDHTVFNTDSVYTYQWKKNGVIIPGETDSILTFPSTTIADAGNYRCEVTCGNGYAVASNEAFLVVDGVTGTENLSAGMLFSLYPNPAADFVHIQSSSQTPAKVLVFDAGGRIMSSENFQEDHFVLDVRSFPAGMYTIEIQSGQDVYREKLLKN